MSNMLNQKIKITSQIESLNLKLLMKRYDLLNKNEFELLDVKCDELNFIAFICFLTKRNKELEKFLLSIQERLIYKSSSIRKRYELYNRNADFIYKYAVYVLKKPWIEAEHLLKDSVVYDSYSLYKRLTKEDKIQIN